MLIKKVNTNVFKVNNNSIIFILEKDQDDKLEHNPRLMVTASRKSFDKMMKGYNGKQFKLKEGLTINMDLILRLDDSYNLWMNCHKLREINPKDSKKSKSKKY